MKVIAYIQAVSQVILNIASTPTQEKEHSFKLIAATMSALSEYIFNSTLKIRSAATQAISLIISHGLSKLRIDPHDLHHGAGFSKVYMNLKYFLSSRFVEYTPGNQGAIECSLKIVKVFAEKVGIPDQQLSELLSLVSELKVGRN